MSLSSRRQGPLPKESKASSRASTRKGTYGFWTLSQYVPSLIGSLGIALEIYCSTLRKQGSVFLTDYNFSSTWQQQHFKSFLSLPPSAQFTIQSVVLRQLSVGTCHGSNFSYYLFQLHTHILLSSFQTKIFHQSVLESHEGSYYQKLCQWQ